MILGLLDILQLSGFSWTAETRLVRHQDNRYPVDELVRGGWLELYQKYQGRPVFRRVDQIISFYGLPGTRAAFYGVYHVQGEKAASAGDTVPECPWSVRWHQEAGFFYDLHRDTRFDDLRHRIVVDWGRATRSWVQKPANKPVLRIEEPGRRLPPFGDYLEFSLPFTQLKDLFAAEDAHREWRSHLAAVAGVYLVLAESTGDLYVGSASGEGGIWGRWREYSATGHGGNKLLRDLIAADPAYPAHFRFSVLHVLPKTMAREEVLRREAVYKQKLGSRATGLNSN